MPTTITFRRGTAAPTQATGLTLGEPAFDSTNRNLYVGLGPGVTAAWVGARITNSSADIAAGLTNWIVNAKAVNDYVTSLGGISSGTAVTWTALQTFTAGISAAGGITLASPNLTGTPLATTAAVGTNTTQIATTAFVNSEIIADAVTAFNGRTGSVQGVSAAVAGDGISVSGATGSVTFTNTGVTRAAAGTGISVSANTGTVTITNTGVLSFNGNTGVLQGVSAAVAGDGISVSGATGSVTITNSGVTRAVAGTGIGLNANTGTVTITNNGVQSFNGNTGAVTGASLGANTFTGLQTSSTGFSGPLTGTATNASALGGTAASGWAQKAAANTFTALQSFTQGISAGVSEIDSIRTNSIVTFPGNNLSVIPFAPDSSASLSLSAADVSFGFWTFTITPETATADRGFTLPNESGTFALRGANTFTGLQTLTAGLSAAGGITFNGTITGATATFSRLVTGNAGFSGALTGTATNASSLGNTAAASWALLASPTFTGTPAAPTAPIGTNTTQIATTAFVQSEIVADTVTSFNGRTGAVQGVSAAVAGDGISVSGATGAVTITNTGVTRAVAGTGIGLNANTGTVTITNNGVQSFNGSTGAVGGVCAAQANTFTALQTFTTGISAAGVTANTLSVKGTSSFQGTAYFNSLSVGINAATAIINSVRAAEIVTPDSNLRVRSLVFPGTASLSLSATDGGADYSFTITPEAATASRGFTLPNESGTFALRGANTFTGLQTLTAGLSAAGGITFNGTITGATATFSRLVTGNAGFSGALTGTATNASSLGGTAASGWAQIAGANTFTAVNTFNSGVTLASTLDVTGLAKFNGNVTIGDNAADVLTVTSGATFGITDHSGVARFASGVTFSSTTDHAGVARFAAGITANTIDISGTSRFTGDVSMGATLTVSGNLIVNGTTTTINSTTISVDDKNIVLGDIVSPTDAGADGGGWTLKGTTDKNLYWKQSNVGSGNTLDVGGAWNSDQHLNLASVSGKFYIHQTEVLSKTALGSSVVSSSLTSVGTVTSGTWNSDIVYVDGGSY